MIDYHKTFRTLENALAEIEESAEFTTTLSGIVEAILAGPGPGLGLVGGRLYAKDPDKPVYRVVAVPGVRGKIKLGFSVPADYPPVQRVLVERFLLMEAGDPGLDPRLEERVGAKRFAAIAVGGKDSHFIAFTVDENIDPLHAIYLLGTVRHLINLRLSQGDMLHDLAEARKIQLSLLPETMPEFADLDIAARSLPAEDVGGDLFDFPLLTETQLGLAVADSCGHGLPAALMARDVITGMRVALDGSYRMTSAVERVNRVLSRSALASRFISLFYVEFERGGNLVYCNAGHPPGLLWRQGRITRLKRGGMVLGPNPRASYQRSFAAFPKGSALLLFTDGITEASSPKGKFFGIGRLERCLREMHHLCAEEIVERVFNAASEFAPGARGDDQTLVVVRRRS